MTESDVQTKPTTPSVSGNVVVVSIVVIVVVVIGAVTYAITNGRDAAQIIGLVGMFLGPTIGVLFNLIKTDRQDSKLGTIQRNTNGALSRMEDRLADLENPTQVHEHYYEPMDPPTPIDSRTRWDMRLPADYADRYEQYPPPQPWNRPPPERPLRDRVRPEPQFRPGAHRAPETPDRRVR